MTSRSLLSSVLLCSTLLCSVLSAQLKVASLHPITTDLLKQIGGEQVEIVAVVRPGMDVHSFQPKGKDVQNIQSCQALFAMGKGLEPYLPGLLESIGTGIKSIEVGRSIPSQKVDADPIYTCCPNHGKNAVDPHWWHNVKNLERAVKVVYKELSELDPANKESYKTRGEAVRKKYRNLHNWVKGEVSKIPKKQRILVTAHVAFAYFCKEYGFEAAYVQGLSRESEISAKDFVDTIKALKAREVKAVFPEKLSNPKMLSQIAKEAGAKVGKPLYADDVPESYEQMIFHNINAITSALQ